MSEIGAVQEALTGLVGKVITGDTVPCSASVAVYCDWAGWHIEVTWIRRDITGLWHKTKKSYGETLADAVAELLRSE